MQISAGSQCTCAVTSGGEVRCWGNGGDGQLGHGSEEDSNYPVTVLAGEGSSEPLKDIVQVSTRRFHTCVVTSGGEVKCWGYGAQGQLGHNQASLSLYPVNVAEGREIDRPLRGVTQVSLGTFYTCAFTLEQEVKCWGTRSNGILGSNPTDFGGSFRRYPASIFNEEDQVFTVAPQLRIPPQDILVGETFSYGVQSENIRGVSGNTLIILSSDGGSGVSFNDNTFSRSSAFTEVGSYTIGGTISDDFETVPWSFVLNVKDITAPQLSLSEQTILWGENFSYTIDESQNISDLRSGEGYTITLTDGGGTDVAYDATTKVFSGDTSSLATGNYYIRGSISDEQGNESLWSFPLLIFAPDLSLAINDVKEGIISTGDYHGCALVSGGRVKCWGFNRRGQLGNNTTTDSLYPVYVLSGGGDSSLSPGRGDSN